MATLSKNHKKLLKLLKKEGFEWEDQTRNNHNKISIKCPNGNSFKWIFASTPSDRFAWKKETAQLRRELRDNGYADARERLAISSDDEKVSLNALFDAIELIERELSDTGIT